MLETLRRAEVLRAAEDGDDDRVSYVLARPATEIPAGDVLRLADEDPTRSAPEQGDRALLASLAEARRAAVGGRTLADIARTREERASGR